MAGFFEEYEKEYRKIKKRYVLEINRIKGKYGEEKAKLKYIRKGYEIIPTGRGSDFKAIKRDRKTGKIIEEIYVEVKTVTSPLSKAKLSKRQRKTKRKLGKKFKKHIEFFP